MSVDMKKTLPSHKMFRCFGTEQSYTFMSNGLLITPTRKLLDLLRSLLMTQPSKHPVVLNPYIHYLYFKNNKYTLMVWKKGMKILKIMPIRIRIHYYIHSNVNCHYLPPEMQLLTFLQYNYSFVWFDLYLFRPVLGSLVSSD